MGQYGRFTLRGIGKGEILDKTPGRTDFTGTTTFTKRKVFIMKITVCIITTPHLLRSVLAVTIGQL